MRRNARLADTRQEERRNDVGRGVDRQRQRTAQRLIDPPADAERGGFGDTLRRGEL
jgi:hypothetical protein